MNKRRYIIYARAKFNVTTRSARAQAQAKTLTAFAKRHRLHLVDTLVEEQEGKERPLFDAMLRRIEAGEANAILAVRPDRLARLPRDTGRIVHLWDTGKLAHLCFSSLNIGQTMLGMMMTIWREVESVSRTATRSKRYKARSLRPSRKTCYL